MTSCLREPTDNLAKQITNIEKHLLADVDNELFESRKLRKDCVQRHKDEVQNIKDQSQQAKQEIDTITNSLATQLDERSKTKHKLT